MKALILAGGRGKRLGDLTQVKNKCMLEVHGKPLIAYSLGCASQMPISEIIVIVGYQAEDIMKTIGNSYNGKPVRYVFQSEQRGLVHAIQCAKDAVGGEDFFLFLGDELMINTKHREMVERYEKEKPFLIAGVIKVKDPSLICRTYGITEKEGKIVDLIEKPDLETINSGAVSKDVMGTGNIIFCNDIFGYIEKTPINPKRGERELPDLIKVAIQDGKVVKSALICDEYFNVNLKEQMKEAESYFAHFSEEENHTS